LPGVPLPPAFVLASFVSSRRFFAAGAFFMVVAVPFLVLLGAGLFRGFVLGVELVESSVVGIGTDDSRKGDCMRMLFSLLSDAMAFETCTSGSEGRRSPTGEASLGVGACSCFIVAGVMIPSTTSMAAFVSSGEAFVIAGPGTSASASFGVPFPCSILNLMRCFRKTTWVVNLSTGARQS
jgi:hypothetical protein